jgi:hypothetical protein
MIVSAAENTDHALTSSTNIHRTHTEAEPVNASETTPRITHPANVENTTTPASPANDAPAVPTAETPIPDSAPKPPIAK